MVLWQFEQPYGSVLTMNSCLNQFNLIFDRASAASDVLVFTVADFTGGLVCTNGRLCVCLCLSVSLSLCVVRACPTITAQQMDR